MLRLLTQQHLQFSNGFHSLTIHAMVFVFSDFHCSVDHCLNGGTCMVQDNPPGLQCLCDPGFIGSRCETCKYNITFVHKCKLDSELDSDTPQAHK